MTAGRDWDVIDEEERISKKYRKLMKKAVYCIGGGFALFIVHMFFPDIDGEGKAKALMNGLGLVTLAYGLVIVTAMIFARSNVFKINFFLLFFIVPAAVIKVLTDTL